MRVCNEFAILRICRLIREDRTPNLRNIVDVLDLDFDVSNFPMLKTYEIFYLVYSVKPAAYEYIILDIDHDFEVNHFHFII